MTNILGSRYPIVAMAMNQVSDISLAKAVRQSGGIPSLSIFNYPMPRNIGLSQDLDEYFNTFGDYKLFVSTGVGPIISSKILDVIVSRKIEFVELILDEAGEIEVTQDRRTLLKLAIDKLINNNIKIFTKCLSLKDIIPGITGVILKGKDGAGRGTSELNSLFESVKSLYPELQIIVSGGIGTPEQVKYYIDNGAVAVGVGTMLSVATESKISLETKLKIISSSSSDIKNFSNGAKQNALIFSELENTDYNHTAGISIGINDPTNGHVFAGRAIDYAKSIKSSAEIISELVSKLDL